MPKTADERGLANPFDPEEAIPKSAELLANLKQRFGNLGLAAAAYNAGPARVANWLAGHGNLPAETRDCNLDFLSGHNGSPVRSWQVGIARQARQLLPKPERGSCLSAVTDKALAGTKAGPIIFSTY
jgi:hypothetical protein